MAVIIDVIVRGAAFLLLAAGVSWLAGRRTASLGALVLAVAMAALLVLPAARAWLPEWQVAFLPPVARSQSQHTAPPAPAMSHEPPAAVGASAGAAPAAVIPDTSPAPSPTGAEMRAPDTGSSTGVRVEMAAAGIWLAGVLFLLGRLVAGRVALGRTAAAASRVEDARWHALVASVRAAQGIRRRVDVRMAEDVSLPAVAGIWRPVLLLPADAGDWPDAVRHDVVQHELAHVARWDAATRLVSQVACAVHWANPLVWIVNRRLETYTERACDDMVLRAGTRASEYAARLIDLASHGRGSAWHAASLAMASRSRLRHRITAVLDPRSRRDPLGIGTTAAVTAGMLVVFIIGAAATPVPTRVARPVSSFADRAMIAAPLATNAALSVDVSGASEAVDPQSALGGAENLRFLQQPPPPPPAPSVPPAPPAPPAPPPPVVAAGFCTGPLDESSSSMHEDDGERRWKVRLRGAGCEVTLDAEGRIEFNDTFTDIAGLDTNGYFRLDTTADGVRRRLEIRRAGTGLARTYAVDGQTHAWDADAARWLADFLVALDRRTAVGIDIRLPRLLESGGVPAVLAETGMMPGDYARSRYYAGLLDRRTLSAGERRQLVEQAAALTTSDFYASETLKRIVAQGRVTDPAERAAVVAMLGKMDSDFYRASTVEVLADGDLTGEQVTAVLQVAADIDSDHYKAQVMRAILDTPSNAPLDEAARSAVVSAVSGIDSDFYAADVLSMLARRGLVGAAERQAFLQAVGHMDSDHYVAQVLHTLIPAGGLGASDVALVLDAAGAVESDHYRRQVLGTLLDAGALSEQSLLDTVRLATGMSSDHYEAAVLVDVARNAGATPAVRQAILDAAGALSDTYAGQVLRAARGQ